MVGSNVSLAGTNVITSGKVLATAMPSGAVLQVVSTWNNATVTTTNTSGSPVGVGTTLSITPTSASSKILFIVLGGNSFNDTQNYEIYYFMGRNIGGAGYTVVSSSQIWGLQRQVGTGGGNLTKSCMAYQYLDSPATTSNIVYQPYFSTNGSGTAYFNQGGVGWEFTLMEIAA
jgi:hypothetical protein